MSKNKPSLPLTLKADFSALTVSEKKLKKNDVYKKALWEAIPVYLYYIQALNGFTCAYEKEDDVLFNRYVPEGAFTTEKISCELPRLQPEDLRRKVELITPKTPADSTKAIRRLCGHFIRNMNSLVMASGETWHTENNPSFAAQYFLTGIMQNYNPAKPLQDNMKDFESPAKKEQLYTRLDKTRLNKNIAA